AQKLLHAGPGTTILRGEMQPRPEDARREFAKMNVGRQPRDAGTVRPVARLTIACQFRGHERLESLQGAVFPGSPDRLPAGRPIRTSWQQMQVRNFNLAATLDLDCSRGHRQGRSNRAGEAGAPERGVDLERIPRSIGNLPRLEQQASVEAVHVDSRI